jgi:prepilin-type N-terminal cleavage/methylation domain-containing protein
MRQRRRSRGFTLLEVMAALSISAIVVTLAASALRAGLDVRERILAHREGVEAEARLRAWVTDLLRHPASASSVDGALFQLVPDTDGRAADQVRWTSEGVESPYGAGPLWRVTMGIEGQALHVRATPLGRDNVRATIEAVLPHVIGLRAEALDAAGGAGNQPAWRTDWPLLRAMPSAVRFTFVLSDGSLAIPFVVETAPLPGGTA